MGGILMSDEGRAYVVEHSTYTGIAFLVHYMLGDLENATHGHELWMGSEKLAYRCGRISTRTLARIRARMVADGYLEPLTGHTGRDTTAHYRFVFLYPQAVDQSVDNLSADPANGGQTGQGRETSTTSCPYIGTEGTKTPESDPFDEFYAVYPLHKAPDAARRAFARALKRASFEEIMNGARCYRDDPTRKPDFTKHPATWLNAGCWQDYAEDPAGHAEALPPGGIRPFPPAEVGPDFSVDADARRAQRARLAALKAAR
jgi:hypothetical protein